MCPSSCESVCHKVLFHRLQMQFFTFVCVLYMSPKVCTGGKYISTYMTEKGILIYMPPYVTIQDTRLLIGEGTSGAVKSLIQCVNLLVNLNFICLKVPTCKESFVTLVAEVICHLCVCVCVLYMFPKVNFHGKHILHK